MAEFPIKMLKDEEGKPFVPVVSAKTIILTSGYDLDTELNKRLKAENIIGGRNITVDKDGNNCTINGPAIMNNLTTDASNKGVLDAYQGKVLNDKFTELDERVDDNKAKTDEEIKKLQNRATNLENNKVDKREGYDLSKNDFTDALKEKLDGIEAGAQVNTVLGVKGDAEQDYRIGNINITKANIGLSEVENKNSATIRSELTSTNVTDALGYTPMDAAIKGKPNGVAELDGDGKVPASQLPSYVDDVLEFDNKDGFPKTGETGKIYVAKDTNLTYRWSGSDYIEISQSLALGETAETAYRGDRGAAAYKHAVTNKGSKFASGFYKIETNDEGHVIGTVKVSKNDIVDLGVPGSDTTYNDATQTEHGLMSSDDKKKLDNLANVAISGSYEDLIDKPYIPEKVSDLENDLKYVINETDPTVPSHVKSITVENIDFWNNKSDFTGNYEDLTNKPFIPKNTSELNNDAGFLTSFTETDPTVPAWAKQPYKPNYTASEVGALPEDTFIPTKTSDIVNDSGFINDVQLTTALSAKQDKLTAGAHISIEGNVISAEGATKLSELDNDMGYITKSVNNLDNYLSKTNTTTYNPTSNYHPATKKYVDDAIFNAVPNLPDNIVTSENTVSEDKVRVVVSETKPELVDGYVDLWINPKYSSSYDMLAEKEWVEDKLADLDSKVVHTSGNEAISGTKTFNTIPVGPAANPTTDNQLTRKAYVDAQIASNKFSGSYNDLTNKPTIPTKVSELTNDKNYISSYTETDPTVPSHVKSITTTDISNWNNKSTFSGSYKDLTDKPNIPTVPTNVGAFTNDAEYITKAVSDLTNYYTKNDIDNILDDFSSLSLEIITSFPTNPSTTTIYLKAKSTSQTENVYDEYIYINGKWEKIGDTAVDLSNYYNKSEVDTKVNAKVSTTDFNTHKNDTTVHITAAERTAWNNKSNFSGSYNDLTNKPNIPAAQVNSDWNATSGLAQILNKPTIPAAGTSNPIVAGTASPGSAAGFARIDHIHPAQTSVSGNAGTATKLAKAVKINGVSFDGSEDITIETGSGSDDTKLPLAGGTMTGTISSQIIQPKTNNTYTLGTSSLKWSNVYATTFTGNLTGNVTGNVSGSSGSCTGNAATATTATTATTANKVANSLTIQTNGTTQGTFNGSSGVTVNLPIPNIYTGTSEPSNSTGNNGDFYIMKF